MLLMDADDVGDALDRLDKDPHHVVLACLCGATVTAIDELARADDDILDLPLDDDTALKALKALRHMCRAYLILRQAKRLAEMWEARP
jgi:hypothetical protein